MLFNSFTFLVFFCTFFLLYWKLFYRSLKIQNIFLLLSSYLFYGWWDWRFLSLIILTTISDFIAGKLIEDKPNYKKLTLLWTLILNLGILFYFKYAGFFINSFQNVFGIELGYVTKNIILPVGISFYTFQSISYVVDVYKNKIKPCRNFLNYACFIAFFPQLVAGPIERAGKLLPQMERLRIFDYNKSTLACQLILWGYFKKIFIADNCALLVDEVFNHQELYGMFMHWFGIAAFALQIYCDFSGYSEIAIGVALLLGFELMQNFKYPYLSNNIKEFWKCWHISLTTWFKDYIFIPLGGSKESLFRNVFVVFLLSGLWHGANYTFILWGLYHAILYVVFIKFIEHKIEVPKILAWILTIIVVLIGWVFFRANNLSEAKDFIGTMFNFNYMFKGLALDSKIIVGGLILFIMELLNKRRSYALDISYIKLKQIRWAIYLFLIYIILAYGQFDEKSFIYFNF